MIIRKATSGDLIFITDIYNEVILNSTATFDTKPKTQDEQNIWFQKHQSNYPVFIVETDGKHLSGWASLSPWSDRCAYSRSAEVSIYIHKDFQQKGFGSLLLKSLIDAAMQNGFHTLLSRITSESLHSIKLHERFGFKTVGVIKEVGFKFDRYLDVTIMQLFL